MAPEVLQSKEYNQKCDLWSAGVILYLFLTGEPPFQSTTREGLIKLIIDGTVNYTGNY